MSGETYWSASASWVSRLLAAKSSALRTRVASGSVTFLYSQEFMEMTNSAVITATMQMLYSSTRVSEPRTSSMASSAQMRAMVSPSLVRMGFTAV